MNSQKAIIYFFFITVLFCPFLAVAQEAQNKVGLRLETGEINVAPGSEIVVSIKLDSASAVNALNLQLSYPQDILRPVILNDGGSVVDLWKTREWNTGNGTIILSGGMLKPFSGINGDIVKFTFKAEKEGVAQISFAQTDIYYADGLGTKAEILTQPLRITVNSKSSLVTAGSFADTESPVFEFLEHSRNPANGRYLAVFLAKDAGSGIKSLSIREKKWFTYGSWKIISNPVEISRGVWQYQISAVDNYDNTTIKTVSLWVELAKKAGLLILFLLSIVVLYTIIRKWVFLKR